MVVHCCLRTNYIVSVCVVYLGLCHNQKDTVSFFQEKESIRSWEHPSGEYLTFASSHLCIYVEHLVCICKILVTYNRPTDILCHRHEQPKIKLTHVGGHIKTRPPLAQVTLPVAHLELESHRNATMGTTSSTVAIRFSAGVCSLRASSTSKRSVSVVPYHLD